jgi:signal transduction histidine kinase
VKRFHSPKTIAFLMAVAAVILVVFAIAFIRIEMKRQRASMEYQVFQMMTGIVETWSSDSGFDPRKWPQVTGFGVYQTSGLSAYRYGTAPAYLDPGGKARSRFALAGAGTTVTMVRQLGFIPPMRGDFGMDLLDSHQLDSLTPEPPKPEAQVPWSTGPDARNFGDPPPKPHGPGMVGDRYAFIEISVAPLVREGWIVIFAVIVALAFFFCIVFLVVSLARALQRYRIREKESSHLVQIGGAARTLAHEIKNPLGVIRVQCATLRRTVPPERLGNIAVIEEETARLATLTDRVRDFLHASAGSPEVRDASSFLDRCRERHGGKIFVVPIAPGEEGLPAASVFIDPDRMMQILDNLISNALDASEGIAPELSLAVQRGSVAYSVSDSGCGIDQSNRGRLFEPFFTTKVSGSGIGLALSRRFAEQACGTLAYAPRPGGGSVFTLTLPEIIEATNKRGAY